MINKKILLAAWGLSLLATNLVVADESNRHWGVDVSVSGAHQAYSSGTGDFYSLDIAPYWNLGNWSIVADLPWQSIDGNYFRNGRFPRLANLCERLNTYSDARIQRLVARGRITVQQLETCNQLAELNRLANESRSGVGDASLSANYQFDLNTDRSWWAGAGLSYSLDTGDYNQSLGSGTRDLSLQASLGTTQGRWNVHWLLGYTHQQSIDSTEELQNYAQAAVDVAYDLTDSLSLGANYQFEQSAIKDDTNLKMWQAYADWRLNDAWLLHAYWSQYTQQEGFPDSEFGASLGYSF